MEEIDFEIGTFRNFECYLTLTLTLDQGQGHMVVNHLSSTTPLPNFIRIGETFCGRTDVRTYGRTDGRTDIESRFIRSSLSDDLKSRVVEKS